MTSGLYGETKFHEFYESLAQSLKDSNADFIDDAYRKAFPEISDIKIVDDKFLQKRGIDKVLFLGEKQVFVDEKIRRCKKDYPDILLEEYSNLERGIPGWLGRGKYTDYIAYIKFPQKKMYLLPFLLLQLAWKRNYAEWKKEYGIRSAINTDRATGKFLYTTTNIPIPIDVLYRAMWRCSFVKLVDEPINL